EVERARQVRAPEAFLEVASPDERARPDLDRREAAVDVLLDAQPNVDPVRSGDQRTRRDVDQVRLVRVRLERERGEVGRRGDRRAVDTDVEARVREGEVDRPARLRSR